MSRERNTKVLRSRFWGPNTWNNYTTNNRQILIEYCKEHCKEWAISEEVGENGTPHLQFCFKFNNDKRFDTLKKEWPEVHFEKSKSWFATFKYCTKTETNISTLTHEKKIKDPLMGLTLKEWQMDVLSIVDNDPHPRKIHWIYDENGGCGKTTFAKSLVINKPRNVLYLSGKCADIKYGIYQFLQNAKNDLKICIFDLTRSIEGYVSYEAIECVKNGIFYNTKYECGMAVFEQPHVIIFSNFLPEKHKLSADRWDILDVSQMSQLSEG